MYSVFINAVFTVRAIYKVSVPVCTVYSFTVRAIYKVFVPVYTVYSLMLYYSTCYI